MLDYLLVLNYTSLSSFCKFKLNSKEITKQQTLNLGEPVIMIIAHIYIYLYIYMYVWAIIIITGSPKFKVCMYVCMYVYSIMIFVAHNAGKHQWNASSIAMFTDANGRWCPIVQSHWSKHYFVLGLIVSSRQKVLMLRRGCPSGAMVKTLQSLNEITQGNWNLFRASTDAMRKLCCYVTRSARHP